MTEGAFVPGPIVVEHPRWFSEIGDVTLGTVEERMRFTIDLSVRNVAEDTGGPFAAAVFEQRTGRLVAAGVNLVLPSNAAVMHAEVVAVAAAGQRLGRFDLGEVDDVPTELVASTEPCAMCFGATIWSGVTRLVCGARAEDAEAIGFDEGPKIADWVGELESRGIEVIRDVERRYAADVLQNYLAGGGRVYNARSGG
jgi:tRNA(Arg) A34 adenosine deaminase TadA